MADIKTVAIIGAGQMGCGIAHVLALSGIEVFLNDIGDSQIEMGLTSIAKNLDRQVASEKITQADSDAALARIAAAADIARLADADLVIEAASENEAVKIDILKARSYRTPRLSPPIPLPFQLPVWPPPPGILKISSACIS